MHLKKKGMQIPGGVAGGGGGGWAMIMSELLGTNSPQRVFSRLLSLHSTYLAIKSDISFPMAWVDFVAAIITRF